MELGSTEIFTSCFKQKGEIHTWKYIDEFRRLYSIEKSGGKFKLNSIIKWGTCKPR